jgi:anti-sigma-K factor RskA
MNAMSKEAPERQDIEALLPWHAAGTLSRRDAQRVEQALASDQDLARQYQTVREELAETIRLNESLGAPSARAMEKLFAAIDAEPAPRRRRSLDLSARVAEFLAGFSPRTLAWSASAAALAIMLQAGIIAAVVIKDRGAGFEVASGGVAATAGGSFALVRFQPEANAADITRFLETNKLTVVGGPASGGLYRVRVADANAPKDEVARVMERIQGDRLISFAAPTP